MATHGRGGESGYTLQLKKRATLGLDRGVTYTPPHTRAPHSPTHSPKLLRIVESARYNRDTSNNLGGYHMEGQKTHVVVTRIGDYWVTQAQARTVAEGLNGSKYITLEGSMISVYSIDAIVTAEQYKLNSAQRGKSWRCRYGNVHTANEPCRCGIALASPTPPRELDISDDQKLRNIARTRATSEYIRANLGTNTAALKDTAARDKYVADRTPQILATLALDEAGELVDLKANENAPNKKDARRAPQKRSK